MDDGVTPNASRLIAGTNIAALMRRRLLTWIIPIPTKVIWMFDPFELKNLNFIEFDRGNRIEQEFAHMLTTLTVNWGRLECYILAIVFATDSRKTDWVADIFKTNVLEKRKEAAKEAFSKPSKSLIQNSCRPWMMHSTGSTVFKTDGIR